MGVIDFVVVAVVFAIGYWLGMTGDRRDRNG